MQQYCRFEIISVNREENFLPCSTEWDKSVYFTPSNHTITADNEKKFAKHQEIAEKLETSFYFCTPCHSWERGANENTNGLIGRYFPKGTDFSEINNEFVAWVENKLNNRPRKRLGYLTPNEKFNSILTN